MKAPAVYFRAASAHCHEPQNAAYNGGTWRDDVLQQWHRSTQVFANDASTSAA